MVPTYTICLLRSYCHVSASHQLERVKENPHHRVWEKKQYLTLCVWIINHYSGKSENWKESLLWKSWMWSEGTDVSVRLSCPLQENNAITSRSITEDHWPARADPTGWLLTDLRPAGQHRDVTSSHCRSDLKQWYWWMLMLNKTNIVENCQWQQMKQ